FTPTLARMYAAKAASLPSPTKWFSIGPYFRAEKPQRGRLREFLQWNVDVLGTEQGSGTDEIRQIRQAESEAVRTLISLLISVGLKAEIVQVLLSDRMVISAYLNMSGVARNEASIKTALELLDRRTKTPPSVFTSQAAELGLDLDKFDAHCISEKIQPAGIQHQYTESLDKAWVTADYSVVRGLAYYTSTVFEVIAEGERAIAGGGRYDNLIELFGGPPTRAAGFGMGDVVLGLLLDDKGLMPQGKELMDALSRPAASLRPEAFVVAGSEDEDALIEPLLANLRRGIEHDGFDDKPWSTDRYSVRPMHARRTYKTTRNLKKLLADAEKQHARFAIVLHGPDKVQVKDLDTREELVHDRGDFSMNPQSDAYVGTAIAQRLA
ncbi:MAG: ATP phosphoribosyltransferase regulatory subunit, partial [Phycisphaerales bacterium]|nr:ATP phosphoribosyltransferase regulatory subunit [Phycisphaerales bacterium]